MPEICRFFGIIISMFADDHNPPHFHIRYGDYNAIITLDKGIVKGDSKGNLDLSDDMIRILVMNDRAGLY